METLEEDAGCTFAARAEMPTIKGSMEKEVDKDQTH